MLFVVCFIPLAMHAAVADDAGDIARAAKRNSAVTVTATAARQKSDVSQFPSASSASRQAITKSSDSSVRERTTGPRDGVVVSANQSRATGTAQSVGTRNAVANGARTAVSASPRVSARTARTTTNTPNISARTATSNASRSATQGRSGVQTAAPSRVMANTAPRRISAGTTARAAATGSEIQTAAPTKDYKKCREVYYNCMDEFCANKDTQLKRCACSARINDFTGVKKQLSSIEDKMLDFNQRLLTVNMDKEDADAISKATDGELASQQKDKSASKQILDEISKKLKGNSADNDLTRNLSSISLSLNADSAFDNIDSMMGASTTTKEGVALYNAALPICREMAAEVCDADAASVAESGYQMAVEQDCNTVAKAYETKQGQALEKIREGGALLEMSRLDIHQKRNSDDILACKKKMLDMMSDSTVCGTDLGKCLDNTGRYIDPSTGEAFLTVSLVDLGSLITRPLGDQKWTTASGNDKFVTFLNSKKKYLEPAMENCQDISDRVWDDFIEDALAQIKLAQERKLEDMRQGCTSLTTQCLTNTAKSISEFDARALSIFGVTADKTVNEMCASVKTSCTALLESTSGDVDWAGGMTEIETDKTYASIIQTCREVGKACIIQTCKSISGNFGLCESIDQSVNRKSIINRTACWSEVVKCVADAGQDPIDRILKQLGKNPNLSQTDKPFIQEATFYPENYGHLLGTIIRTTDNSSVTDCEPAPIKDNDGNITAPPKYNCVYDICATCGKSGQPDCATCRLAEKIWGNCEYAPTTTLTKDTDQNMIKLTTGQKFDTLLSWFAVNTNTSGNLASCKDTSCGIGSVLDDETGSCVASSNMSSDKKMCVPTSQFNIVPKTPTPWTNCCTGNIKDAFGNCCLTGASQDITDMNLNETNYYGDNQGNTKICTPETNTPTKFVAAFDAVGGTDYKHGYKYLVCVGSATTTYDKLDATGFPGGQQVKCSGGKFVIINNDTGTYESPVFKFDTDGTPGVKDILLENQLYPANYYRIEKKECVLNPTKNSWGVVSKENDTNTWKWDIKTEECNKISGLPVNSKTVNNLKIWYDITTLGSTETSPKQSPQTGN